METPEDRGTFFPKTTFTPAETVDATVIVHFQNARIETVGFMDSGIMIVVVSIPGGVNGTFRAELGQIPFQCTIQEAIQDRLYCYGSPPVTPGKYPFAVFAGSADRPIFQTMLTTPLMPTPETTPTPRS
ncbi:MAG TPA: hypothetical protein VMT46_18610 [Anaerolineaceae bacterium]|nr:hypothetical protein [Anaerolineaceae bacterium]